MRVGPQEYCINDRPNCGLIMTKSFSNTSFSNIYSLRAQNKHADALDSSPSKVDVCVEAANLRIMKKTLGTTVTGSNPIGVTEEQDWHSSIIQNLNQLHTAKNLKDFMIVNGGLYYRGSEEVLTRALSLTKQKKS